jgi:RNA polymerase sigma factor (sigma-70 family)
MKKDIKKSGLINDDNSLRLLIDHVQSNKNIAKVREILYGDHSVRNYIHGCIRKNYLLNKYHDDVFQDIILAIDKHFFYFDPSLGTPVYWLKKQIHFGLLAAYQEIKDLDVEKCETLDKPLFDGDSHDKLSDTVPSRPLAFETDDDTECKELKDNISRAIDKCDINQKAKEILKLRYVNGLNVIDISHSKKMARGTIRERLKSATMFKKELSKILENE